MHPDLEALLALQAEDAEIHQMEERLQATEPRLRQLDKARDQVNVALERSKTAIDGEEKKHKELLSRVTEHRQMHERNVATLDQVKKMKEATAAVMQVERARRILADEEGELQTVHRRMGELRDSTAARELEAGELADRCVRHLLCRVDQSHVRRSRRFDPLTVDVELSQMSHAVSFGLRRTTQQQSCQSIPPAARHRHLDRRGTNVLGKGKNVRCEGLPLRKWARHTSCCGRSALEDPASKT